MVVLPETCCRTASAFTGVCRLGAGRRAPVLAFSPGHILHTHLFGLLSCPYIVPYDTHVGIKIWDCTLHHLGRTSQRTALTALDPSGS